MNVLIGSSAMFWGEDIQRTGVLCDYSAGVSTEPFSESLATFERSVAMC